MSSFQNYTGILNLNEYSYNIYDHSLSDYDIFGLIRSYNKLDDSIENYDKNFRKNFRVIVLDLLDIKYEIADVSHLFLL